MLTLLLGTDWTENRKEILSRIATDVQNRGENRILLVPELISHDTERRLAATAGDTASRYAQVLSFTRLGRRVMDIVGNASEECLDDCGRVVAMAASARQLHSLLKTYASVETKPEFLCQVLDAVDEFKRCCISPADLKQASEQTEGILSQKLQELSLLMESYDSLCAQGKRDPRDQMTWVLEQLEQIDFACYHTFYVDGFPDFTRQNLAILEHIISTGTDITVSLNCDRLHSTDVAFEKAGQTAGQLWEIANRAQIPVKVELIEPTSSPMQTMCHLLFQGKSKFQPQLHHCVKAVKASSVYQECQVAAQEVMEKVQMGCRYRDISIVCTQMENYAPILRLIFGKCGIPLYLSGTENVLESGVISTVVFALDAALGGFEQRDVLRYLRSTLSPLSQDDCDKIENYACIWMIDRKRWLENWTGHPQGLSEPWNDRSRQELEYLNRQRAIVVEPLSRLQENFHHAKNVASQVKALCDFLEQIQFAQRLEELAQSMDSAGDNRTAQIYNQLWEILLRALEQLYDVLGETVWDEETFVRLLKLLLSQCKVGTIPPVLDSISVGSVSAQRCQQQKHLILLGANEGLLPGYGGSTGLLTDQERVALRALGVPLTGGAVEGLQAEYAEIYGVFCGAEESVTVTCSGTQPSFIYRRLASLSGGELMADTVMTTQLRQPLAAAAYLVSNQDFHGAEELGLAELYRQVFRLKSHDWGRISRENIDRLYGSKLRLSASQVDRQAECRLSYFLKYGLRAKERKEATVDPAQFGTYVHAVLEQTCAAVMEKGGFHAVSLEQTMALAQDFSQSYAEANFQTLDSQRMEYLFRRNMQELEMVVRELWRELSQAAYEPKYYELNFDENGQMPAISIPNDSIVAELRGFVDRVDIWQRGGSAYFRVVDYKTGKKSFDYCDVFNGVGLQMLIYLFALEKAGEQLFEGKPVGAGVQYFPARVPYMSVDGSMTTEEAEVERKSSWKRSGLLLSDEDSLRAMDPSEKMDTLCCTVRKDGSLSGDIADRCQMGLLRDYMMNLLGDMAEEIASGNVEPNPYTRGTSHNACTFCPYGTICHQDTVSGRRNYKAMTGQEFWDEIEKEANKGG